MHPGVQWEAAALEHALLRLALVCFVGDTSVDPRDYAHGHVYTPGAAVVPGRGETCPADGAGAGAKDSSEASRGSVAAAAKQSNPFAHGATDFLALDEW
jgi:hypothetical protein